MSKKKKKKITGAKILGVFMLLLMIASSAVGIIAYFVK